MPFTDKPITSLIENRKTKSQMAEYSIYPLIRTDKPIKRNNKYPIYLRVRIYDRETKLPANLDVAADA